ncbi:protein of unknown function [Shewanella benthica]|uniref:Uncharacterized protein n=1 Tax=Shewanella benthica TaxID=43661 RepID=A0A330M6L7_9GAMM|nr:protein of unknown function [Shewanella benthica]
MAFSELDFKTKLHQSVPSYSIGHLIGLSFKDRHSQQARSING